MPRGLRGVLKMQKSVTYYLNGTLYKRPPLCLNLTYINLVFHYWFKNMEQTSRTTMTPSPKMKTWLAPMSVLIGMSLSVEAMGKLIRTFANLKMLFALTATLLSVILESAVILKAWTFAWESVTFENISDIFSNVIKIKFGD